MTTPAPPANPIPAVFHGLKVGVLQLATQHQLLLVVVVAGASVALARSVRIAWHSGRRDSQRRFTWADKSVLLRLAGHRCEHHSWLGGRCAATELLEADHVHPWSRGGWTNISNGQILCRQHNRAKLASIPWDRSLRKLADHRLAYYPTGAERSVVRRRPRRTTPAMSSSSS